MTGRRRRDRPRRKIPNAERRTRNAERSRTEVIIEAAKEVGPSLFFSLLVITVGFLPVFTLQAQAGRLFKPLAYTKTFAMLFSSFLAVTLTPVLMTLFIRGKISPEEKNPISWLLHKLYEPVAHVALRFRKTVLILAMIILVADRLSLYEARLGIHAAPLRRDALLHAGDRTGGFGFRGYRTAAKCRTDLLKRSRKWRRSSARPAGPKRPPTRPHWRCLKRSSISNPNRKWRQGMTVEKLKDEMNDRLDHPRRGQFLHHADQGPDRYAGHRDPNPGGDKGPGSED